MNRLLCILGSLLIFAPPVSALGGDKANYVSAGAGLYFYAGDIGDDTQLDEAFIGEIAYGRHFHPNFALEGGIGYIHDAHQGDELQGYPLTLTALGIYPLDKVRFFAGGGMGVYFMNFDGEIGNVAVHGEDTVFGGHLVLGSNLALGSSIFVGIEGKYLYLEEAKFSSQKVELDGFTAIAKVGFRF